MTCKCDDGEREPVRCAGCRALTCAECGRAVVNGLTAVTFVVPGNNTPEPEPPMPDCSPRGVLEGGQHRFLWRGDLVQRGDDGAYLRLVAVRYECRACGLWLRVDGATEACTYQREPVES